MNGIEIAYLSDAKATTGVTEPEQINVEAGKTASVNATLAPADSTERVSYISENPEIATVHPRTGEITGIAAGTANIKVTTVSPIAGKEKSAVCKVTVKAKEIKPVPKPPVKKPSMTISGKTTVKKGKASISVKCGTLKKTVKITVK